ncbi:MAG: hypothetical protein FWD58_09595, partial [Firmicutes bacterium]|nr:hypothetical protein [Bacillota bacterium]
HSVVLSEASVIHACLEYCGRVEGSQPLEVAFFIWWRSFDSVTSLAGKQSERGLAQEDGKR